MPWLVAVRVYLWKQCSHLLLSVFNSTEALGLNIGDLSAKTNWVIQCSSPLMLSCFIMYPQLIKETQLKPMY